MKTQTYSLMHAWNDAQEAATARMQPVAVLETPSGYATLPLSVADVARIAKLQAEALPANVTRLGEVCPVVGIAKVTQPGQRWNA